MRPHVLSPDIVRLAVEVGDPAGVASLEAALAQRLILTSLVDIKCSVVLADPMLHDCPLIGCSDGFEALTGYSKSEIRGRNCRFLNEHMPMKPQMRKALRAASATGTEFMGVVTNARKNGQSFRNFLHMTSVYVGGRWYIIGIQSDVTDIELDLTDATHLEDLRSIAQHIFSANVSAWVQVQAYKFQICLPVPYAEVADKSGMKVNSKNTFLHVKDSTVADHAKLALRKNASDPLIFNCSTCRSSVVEVVANTEVSESSTSGANASQSNSYHADVSADSSEGSHSRVRSSRDGEVSETRPQEPSSIGSALHPDKCTECTFFFFGTQGCIKGSNCRFCHEFHPRKNLRKNRRLLKALQSDDSSSLPGEDFACTSKSVPVDLSTSANGRSGAERNGQGPRACGHWASPICATLQCGAGPMTCTEARTPHHAFGTSAMTSIRYLRHGHELRRSKLTLVVGDAVHVPARVASRMESSARKALQNEMIFSVDPPLQHGLHLDPHSGLITGVPTVVQARTLHIVTASIAATGPGGINLGLVPLASTSLLIRTVDPNTSQPQDL